MGRTPVASLPLAVEHILAKLGSDLRDARRRRRIPTAVLAECALISRTTLSKVEKGHPGVALGTYANVLFALGLLDGLGDLADIRRDEVGLALDEERLPKRIRLARSNLQRHLP